LVFPYVEDKVLNFGHCILCKIVYQFLYPSLSVKATHPSNNSVLPRNQSK
jgi:hypothetical protein